MSMKYLNDLIGKRTRDLPAYSAVPQPTALPNTADIKTDVLEIKLGVGWAVFELDVVVNVFYFTNRCTTYKCSSKLKLT
jgi:hypothetical protein